MPSKGIRKLLSRSCYVRKGAPISLVGGRKRVGERESKDEQQRRRRSWHERKREEEGEKETVKPFQPKPHESSSNQGSSLKNVFH